MKRFLTQNSNLFIFFYEKIPHKEKHLQAKKANKTKISKQKTTSKNKLTKQKQTNKTKINKQNTKAAFF